jgi:NAD(P)-dependent dehydrogenase (short-subunit alcohol dehydrogenase family)
MQPAGRTARFAERQPLGFLRSNSTTAAAHGGSKGGVGGKGYAVAPGPAFFTEHGDAIFIKIGQKMQELQTAMRAARALRVSQLGMASQLQVEELETEAELDLARKATPRKRLGQPEEVARVIVFLASRSNDFVTGQVWGVDGGQPLWGDIWPIADEPGEPAPSLPKAPTSRD